MDLLDDRLGEGVLVVEMLGVGRKVPVTVPESLSGVRGR